MGTYILCDSFYFPYFLLLSIIMFLYNFKTMLRCYFIKSSFFFIFCFYIGRSVDTYIVYIGTFQIIIFSHVSVQVIRIISYEMSLFIFIFILYIIYQATISRFNFFHVDFRFALSLEISMPTHIGSTHIEIALFLHFQIYMNWKIARTVLF